MRKSPIPQPHKSVGESDSPPYLNIDVSVCAAELIANYILHFYLYLTFQFERTRQRRGLSVVLRHHISLLLLFQLSGLSLAGCEPHTFCLSLEHLSCICHYVLNPINQISHCLCILLIVGVFLYCKKCFDKVCQGIVELFELSQDH